MRYLTFALAKGRLAKETLKLLEKIGITCEEINDPKTRKLIFQNDELGMRFFLAKPSDVPTYVEYGVADIGVVGRDTLLEEGRNLYEVMDLGFGKCRMCVCGPASAKELLSKNEIIRVASKYPNIAKNYFKDKKNQTVEIIKLNGSVELAPIVCYPLSCCIYNILALSWIDIEGLEEYPEKGRGVLKFGMDYDTVKNILEEYKR